MLLLLRTSVLRVHPEQSDPTIIFVQLLLLREGTMPKILTEGLSIFDEVPLLGTPNKIVCMASSCLSNARCIYDDMYIYCVDILLRIYIAILLSTIDCSLHNFNVSRRLI